jgi:pimeloyl-ACP methyl ester carboxylesterase
VTTAQETRAPVAVELVIDVTRDAAIGMPAHTAATVYLPDIGALSSPPVVCFAFPGGGYSRRYYTLDVPGAAGTRCGQAGWHTDRGWIFVACDQLGFGDATAPSDPVLTYENIALGSKATVAAVMAKLETGTMLDGYQPVAGATTLGIGQSMGGCFTIVLQGHHQTFDGIAALGFSGIHTVVPSRPGAPSAFWPWIPRNSDLANPEILNGVPLAAAEGPTPAGQDSVDASPAPGEHPFAWAFHWDNEPADLVALDMAASAEDYEGPLPPWRSPSTPACGIYMVAPGTVATEAASITVPVLIAVGERDVVPNPWLEPTAFKSSTDISLFVCPRMAHMHNFAHTRQDLWTRIHSWGSGVAAMRAARTRQPRAGSAS